MLLVGQAQGVGGRPATAARPTPAPAAEHPRAAAPGDPLARFRLEAPRTVPEADSTLLSDQAAANVAAVTADAIARNVTATAGDLIFDALMTRWGPQATLYTCIMLQEMAKEAGCIPQLAGALEGQYAAVNGGY